jgi:hypothetical protein
MAEEPRFFALFVSVITKHARRADAARPQLTKSRKWTLTNSVDWALTAPRKLERLAVMAT